MVELFVLIVGMAVGIKLIANSAEARGRNQMLWGLAAGVAYLVGYFLVGLIFARLLSIATANLGWFLLALFIPYLLAALAVGAVGLLIARLGIKVVQRREYDVHCRHNGAGRLEITPEIVRLHWEGRSQEVARSQLQTVAVDGECLRLRWAEGDLLLLPMMRPQTREGRISQSQALARILSPGLPVAIRVDRNAKSAG
jgi:MFS family permease